MKIIWSPQATHDLDLIVDRIAQDKKGAALRWAATVRKKVDRLRAFPKSGRVVPEVGREEIREILIGDYRIIYKVEGSVFILTVFHGAKGSLPDLTDPGPAE